MQVALTYLASAAEGAPSYLSLFAVIAILSNASLPLSSRASLWTTTLCMVLLAAGVRRAHARDPRRGHRRAAAHRALRRDDVGVRASAQPRAAARLPARPAPAPAHGRGRPGGAPRSADRPRQPAPAWKRWRSFVDQRQRAGLAHRRGAVRRRPLQGVQRPLRPSGRRRMPEARRRLRASPRPARDDDVAARYGGEEFILVLPRTALDEARRVAERLRAAVDGARNHPCRRRGAWASSPPRSASPAPTPAGAVSRTSPPTPTPRSIGPSTSGRNCVVAAAPGTPKGPKAA